MVHRVYNRKPGKIASCSGVVYSRKSHVPMDQGRHPGMLYKGKS